MLDLEPRVHLEEVEVARAIDDELDRAGRAVVHGARQRCRLLAHRAPRRGVEERARRLLDHLLVAALDRALALAEVEHRAVAVGQHLDLDVARRLDVALEEHPVVAERRARLALRPHEAFAQVALVERDAHALAAAAGRRLDHHGIADLGGDTRGERRLRDRLGVARHDADAGRSGQPLGLDLVTHRADRGGRRADEDDARGGQRLGEGRVLGKEAVARVDRLRAGRLRAASTIRSMQR